MHPVDTLKTRIQSGQSGVILQVFLSYDILVWQVNSYCTNHWLIHKSIGSIISLPHLHYRLLRLLASV